MEDFPIYQQVALLGFGAGIIFGAVANITNFCTMGALSDRVFMGESNRLRSWFLAIAVAILGTQVLQAMEVINLFNPDNRAIYLSPTLGWSGAILGGLMFGFGMTRTAGCGNKLMVRIGGGNLKSLVAAIVMGLFAYMTLRGLVGLARVEMEALTNVNLADKGLETQSLGDFTAATGILDTETARLAVPGIIALLLLVYCLKDKEFLSSPRDILAGVIVGLLIPTAWWITGSFGFDEFEPTTIFSFTFVAPAGNTLQYLMTFTGSAIDFGVASLLGVIVGSFLVAIFTRSFAIETFNDRTDMIRHLYGGAIMGIGGVLSVGCTIGQGITGMSTGSAGSLIALLSIIVGGVWGLKSLEEGSVMGGLAAMFRRGD